MKTILLAFGFMMVFEGLFPLLAPDNWKEALRQMIAAEPETIRKVAFTVITIGLALVWIVMEIM